MFREILVSSLLLTSSISYAVELKKSHGLLTTYEVKLCKEEMSRIDINKEGLDQIENEILDLKNKIEVNNGNYLSLTKSLDQFKQIMDKSSQEELDIYNNELIKINNFLDSIEKDEKKLKESFKLYKKGLSSIEKQINEFNKSCGNSEYVVQ